MVSIKDLFGRSLPGTIAERHAAILNFLDVGSDEQPSMMFKLGVAEWVVDKKIRASEAAAKRLEDLEVNLTGASRQGNPIVMRVESLLATLLMDPVTSRTVMIPANTTMKFRFMDELSPAKSQAGDYVRLELTDDLIVNQCLVAPAGSLLVTEVREVKRPRMFGIPGEVRLAFNELKPLGPQKPPVFVGSAAQSAIKNARKTGERGEGGVIGAGAVSLAGAALLGPLGLVSGAFIRGNSIKIPAGSVTFVQTSGDFGVSAFPIPESLQVSTNNITSAQPAEENNVNLSSNNNDNEINNNSEYAQALQTDPNQGMIIKRNMFQNDYDAPASSPAANNTGGNFALPPEQSVN